MMGSKNASLCVCCVLVTLASTTKNTDGEQVEWSER